jgi:periplasmic copper chaperone A
MKLFRPLAMTLLLAAATTPALSQQYSAGDITVEKPWARATPRGAVVGAGYLTIKNNGAVADKLMGGSADFAKDVEVHEMSMKSGVMTMRQLTDGLEIPPNGSVALAPSGYHLMFHGLKRQLSRGETVEATLNFQHAGTLKVAFPVQALGAMGPAGGETSAPNAMKGMKMD